MYALRAKANHRSRELRRRVVVPARVRNGAQWTDACILNISSRGLLIHSARRVPRGALVEILRGDQLIMARVVWSEGTRVGLRTDERLPVEDMLSLKQSRALQLIASHGVMHDRRKDLRPARVEARLRGRVIEFLAVGAIAVSLAVSGSIMAEQALALPMAQVRTALAG